MWVHGFHMGKWNQASRRVRHPGSLSGHTSLHLIAASINDKFSVDPSIRPICTRCWSTMTTIIQVWSISFRAGVFIIHTRPDNIPAAMTNMIQEWSNFYRAQVSIIHTRPDDISAAGGLSFVLRQNYTASQLFFLKSTPTESVQTKTWKRPTVSLHS